MPNKEIKLLLNVLGFINQADIPDEFYAKKGRVTVSYYWITIPYIHIRAKGESKSIHMNNTEQFRISLLKAIEETS